MATILAHIRVRPGREADFESMARGLYESSHRLEKDLIRYEYWRGEEPRSYYTLLGFKDLNSFLIHQTSEHHSQVPRAHMKDGESPIESIRLEWVDPIQGASPLPATEPQALSGTATAEMKTVHERMAPKLLEWWAQLR